MDIKKLNIAIGMIIGLIFIDMFLKSCSPKDHRLAYLEEEHAQVLYDQGYGQNEYGKQFESPILGVPTFKKSTDPPTTTKPTEITITVPEISMPSMPDIDTSVVTSAASSAYGMFSLKPLFEAIGYGEQTN